MQLLVLGMHRSGTSVVTRLLNLMGASLGEDARLQPPDPVNPKGYWEREDVRELNQAILRHLDRDWYYVDGLCLDRVSAPQAEDSMPVREPFSCAWRRSAPG